MNHEARIPEEMAEADPIEADAAALAEFDAEMAQNEKRIHRLSEQLHRAKIRQANTQVNRAEVLMRMARPRHFHARPAMSEWIHVADLPAHAAR